MQGSDCVSPFVALQSCIKANPNAFSKDVLEEDDDDVKKQNEVKTEETPKQEYRIIPPLWSVESKKTKRTKLQKALSLSFSFSPLTLGSSGGIIIITTTLTSKSIARKIFSLCDFHDQTFEVCQCGTAGTTPQLLGEVQIGSNFHAIPTFQCYGLLFHGKFHSQVSLRGPRIKGGS